jgi:hypothetical protein
VYQPEHKHVNLWYDDYHNQYYRIINIQDLPFVLRHCQPVMMKMAMKNYYNGMLGIQTVFNAYIEQQEVRKYLQIASIDKMLWRYSAKEQTVWNIEQLKVF